MKLKKYNNNILMDDNSRELPYFTKDYNNIISFLKKKGFKLRVPKNYQSGYYKVLSPSHKIGFKDDVFVILRHYHTGYEIKVGNVKNLWEEETSCWDWVSDSRYTHLNYLEKCRVKLTLNKLISYLEKKYDVKIEKTDDSHLKPEEYIIKKLNNNTHIHGVVNSLDDIKKSITEDSYDYKYNSNDKNGKKIICGEVKYYYDGITKRLNKGVVWHNINNMWWVINSNKLDNVPAYELFDYNGEPRRKPVTGDKIKNIIREYSSNYEFKFAQSIYNKHKDLICH